MYLCLYLYHVSGRSTSIVAIGEISYIYLPLQLWRYFAGRTSHRTRTENKWTIKLFTKHAQYWSFFPSIILLIKPYVYLMLIAEILALANESSVSPGFIFIFFRQDRKQETFYFGAAFRLRISRLSEA